MAKFCFGRCFHFGQDKTIRTARQAIAGQSFILHHFDAQRGPGAGAWFESNYIGIVIGIGTAQQ